MWALLSLAMAQTTSPPNAWGRVDVGDIAVMRPVGTAFEFGFTNQGVPGDDAVPFFDTIGAALSERSTEFDFAAVFLAENLPVQIQGALAFNQTLNRDLPGTGVRETQFEALPIRGALYLNQPSRWEDFDSRIDKYIFNHELGHFWLARANADLGDGRDSRLLGRQLAHWSYFLHTAGSPMEGNYWTDNGDGSFTSDPTVSGDFSDLDLYLMGFISAEEVGPFFLIEPTEAGGRTRVDSPDHYAATPTPTTIWGRRVDLTVDDVIATEGIVKVGPAKAPTSFRILTILVAGPEEVLELSDITRVNALQGQFTKYWAEGTRGFSTISFDLGAARFPMPPLTDPTWIPEMAR